ncbi:hypothetical protein [Helicobacter mustelae]|uniref:hypothetical protein n=1 Tax=Helicobacter mustelae TaxID=217 RepID=UPI00030557D2|nr:hypothetical protein [Helicobacter mustelae]SQH70975.1 Uncharacterised protein [Helicobacter mustelae]STP12102.1 Uncharacterised protein [Helicobacter mustelae]
MTAQEKIKKIDAAINEVLQSLEDGIGITEYTIDGISIKKQSTLEILTELGKMKALIKEKQRPERVQFVFKG